MSFEDVPLVKLMYLVFTRMPGESYRGRLRSLLLYVCYIFRALISEGGVTHTTGDLTLVFGPQGPESSVNMVLHFHRNNTAY